MLHAQGPRHVADLSHKGEWANTFDISGCLIPKKGKKGGKKYGISSVVYERWEVKVKGVEEVKKVQVGGKKHLVLAEDAEIEKLLQRGLSLKRKIKDLDEELDSIQERLIEIARDRRKETTTVTLDGITAQAVITFRESYIVKDEVEDMKVPLGPLFEMFFEKKSEYKATSDFKKFMESDHALGIEAPEKVKAAILKYVSVKETKPYLKMEEKTDGK